MWLVLQLLASMTAPSNFALPQKGRLKSSNWPIKQTFHYSLNVVDFIKTLYEGVELL